MVFFLDYKIAQLITNEVKQFIYPQSVAVYGVDAYIVILYPDDSKRGYISDADKAYWMEHFGKTKPNRMHKRIAKSFLEIII